MKILRSNRGRPSEVGILHLEVILGDVSEKSTDKKATLVSLSAWARKKDPGFERVMIVAFGFENIF